MLIEVEGFNSDDVVVVGEFACLSRESKVGNRRNLEIRDLEALRPLIFGFILKLKLE